MTEEKKKQLFPIFAFLYSKQLNPDKYGKVQSIEEWTKLIQDSPEDVQLITQEASKLSDEGWSEIETQMSQLEQPQGSSEEPQFAKKGAKLENLKKLQKHKVNKNSEPKKCTCGCTMVDKREKGGKIVSSCSCGCAASKKEEGGAINNPKETTKKLDSATKVFKIYQRMKALKIK